MKILEKSLKDFINSKSLIKFNAQVKGQIKFNMKKYNKMMVKL